MIDAAEPAPDESDAESSASEANQAGVTAGITRMSDSPWLNASPGVAANSRRSSSRSAARPMRRRRMLRPSAGSGPDARRRRGQKRAKGEVPATSLTSGNVRNSVAIPHGWRCLATEEEFKVSAIIHPVSNPKSAAPLGWRIVTNRAVSDAGGRPHCATSARCPPGRCRHTPDRPRSLRRSRTGPGWHRACPSPQCRQTARDSARRG